MTDNTDGKQLSAAPTYATSVVIPLWNRASLVRHTLNSLQASHHLSVSLEIIVVVDGSTDGGADLIAEEYPHVVVLRQAHQGAAVARNHGIAASTAATILLLDSDDLIEPGFFAPKHLALESHPNADGAYGPWDVFCSDGEFREGAVRPQHGVYPLEASVGSATHLVRLLRGWYIAPHAILWRSEALRRVGGHTEGLALNQDVDLLFRMLISAAGIVGVPGPRALYRQHYGEREGRIGGSHAKATAALLLRRDFVARLRASDRLDFAAREALGHYCFDRWSELRQELPDIAEGFLDLSREVYPELQLRGRWPLRAASAVLGPARAQRLRDSVERTLGTRSATGVFPTDTRHRMGNS
ncbi:MAG: glycosyltransferase [Gemmatimonadaceae bacterium]